MQAAGSNCTGIATDGSENFRGTSHLSTDSCVLF